LYTFIANERRYIRIMNKITVACISVILESIVSSASYYGLLTREPFSYSFVWGKYSAQAGRRGHYTFPDNGYRRTVPEGEVHNKFST
jgi:hypothetical protein